MPGPASSVANTLQGNAFYINIDTIVNGAGGDAFDSNGTAVAVTGLPASNALGTLVVRDLGKTVRVPGTSSGSGSGSQRILRKVQRFDNVAATTGTFPVTNGFVGFNEGVGGAADSGSGALPSGFQTFYIDLGAAAGALKWARLSL